MKNNKCPHEDWITFGKSVYQDDETEVNLITCDDCKAQGVQVEKWVNDHLEVVAEEWL